MFCDSDFADDKTDRKSLGGYTGKLGNAIVHWRARKQTLFALSTYEVLKYTFELQLRR